MTERPILFSAQMVRAILAGTKSQTRRVVKPQPQPNGGAGLHPVAPYQNPHGQWAWVLAATGMGSGGDLFSCPYGQPGDRLWVREAWAQPTNLDPGPTFYRADYPACVPPHFENVPPVDWVKWKPSIHMRRDQSRILLEITAVRVERLNEISRGDAMAEGCPHPNMASGPDPRVWFQHLWESINGPGSWAANPWVWVVEFKRVPS